MLAMDAPDHGRLRRPCGSGLPAIGGGPCRSRRFEHLADELLDGLLAAQGPARRHRPARPGFAHPLPFAVICELLGIPAADRPDLHAWFQVLLTGWAGDPPAEAVEASGKIVAYLRELVATKRRNPAEDLVSVLVAASDDALTTQELLSSLFQLIVAGHDTTASLIGNGVVALLDHPGPAPRAAGRFRPASRRGRRAHPVHRPGTSCHVPGDDRAGDRRRRGDPRARAGAGVPRRRPTAILAASPHPTSSTSAADDGPNLGFGHGIHYCLGAPLARLEARVAVRSPARPSPWPAARRRA